MEGGFLYSNYERSPFFSPLLPQTSQWAKKLLPAWFDKIHTVDGSIMNAEVRYSLCEMLLGSKVGVLQIYTCSARHMHTLYQCQWSSRGSNMILVKMSTFLFQFYIQKESERQNVKANNRILRKNCFYQSTQFSHSSQRWVKNPRRCISGVMHFTFAMLTCNDVHKLELWIFFSFNKRSPLPIRWMGDDDFYLLAKKWQKCPTAF